MKLLDKYILAAAKRIEAKNKISEDLEREKKEAYEKLFIEYKEKTQKLIEDYTFKITTQMLTDGCHLKVGDTAVLNYYELDYNCRNGWDTGPDAILSNVPVEVKRNPLKVKITDVSISDSLYREILSSFYKHLTVNDLRDMLDQTNVLVSFTNYCRYEPWPENCGLFWEAKFEPINFDFRPVWGLNAGSFLVEGTYGAIFTENYWKRQGKVQTKWEEANYDKNEFEIVLNKMLEMYRNNEI